MPSILSFPFSQLPSEWQVAIARYLPLDETRSFSCVSKDLNTKLLPLIWGPVAASLALPVSVNPKEDVLAYYSAINQSVISDLDKVVGAVVEKNPNPLLQYRNIENYIKARSSLFYKSLLDYACNNRCDILKLLITHISLDPSHPQHLRIISSAMLSNNREILEVLSGRGVIFNVADLEYAIEGGHWVSAKFIAERVDIASLNEFDFTSCLPEIVNICINRGLVPTQAMINIARDMGKIEIAEIFEKHLAGNHEEKEERLTPCEDLDAVDYLSLASDLD